MTTRQMTRELNRALAKAASLRRRKHSTPRIEEARKRLRRLRELRKFLMLPYQEANVRAALSEFGKAVAELHCK